MGFHDSSARSREVGEELRKRRKNAGLTGTELARRLGWSLSKVSRIESGLIGVSEVDAAIYLVACGVLQDELEELLALVRENDTRTWLQERGTRLPDELRTLVYHEATAATIASYESMLVPGLLQTEAYARALFEFGAFIPQDRVALAVQARMDRQSVLRCPNPPQCVFYLHENGLRSIVGGDRIMHDQLLQLVFLTSRPQYEIRVVLADSGPHGAWGAMFMLLGYQQHSPVVFMDGMTTSLFLEKPADITIYREILNRLDRAALDAEQSRQWLARLARHYDKPEGGSDA